MKTPDNLNVHGSKERNFVDLNQIALRNNKIVISFRKRYYRVMLLTIPILMLTEKAQAFIGINNQFYSSTYIILSLATLIFLYGGWPFLKGLLHEVRTKNPGKMFAIGTVITIAYFYSIAIILGLLKMDFFWELIALIMIMILDYWVQIKSIAKTSKEMALINQSMPIEKMNVIQQVAFIE
jgi:Cu2+-exporting ATPase